MALDRSGIPYVAAALLPALAALAVRRPRAALAFALLGGAFAFFFRDPERDPPPDPDAVLAPADGRVMHAGDADAELAPPGPWRHVGIFLSPLDVHVNRIPISGRVTRVSYQPGRFLPAYRRESGRENERSEFWIDHEGQTIVCRQVVGVLARRIVCRVAPGMTVEAGERFGIMKFGSRMDVFVPPSATLAVSVGQHVRAGESVLARLARGELVVGR